MQEWIWRRISKRQHRLPWLQAVVHIVALMPLEVLVWMFWQDQLGPDPTGEVIRRLGRYGLVFLILSLVPTALRITTGYTGLLHVRRALGLYAFFYAALHTLAFGLDYGFDLGLIATAILEGRREIVGVMGLGILAILALTSIPGLMRLLGGYWKRLHRLVYLAGGLVVLHYAWNYKELRVWSIVAGVTLLLLLAVRVPLIASFLRRQRGTRS